MPLQMTGEAYKSPNERPATPEDLLRLHNAANATLQRRNAPGWWMNSFVGPKVRYRTEAYRPAELYTIPEAAQALEQLNITPAFEEINLSHTPMIGMYAVRLSCEEIAGFMPGTEFSFIKYEANTYISSFFNPTNEEFELGIEPKEYHFFVAQTPSTIRSEFNEDASATVPLLHEQCALLTDLVEIIDQHPELQGFESRL